MKDFLKKLTVGNILALISGLLVLVAFIFAIVTNAVVGYSVSKFALVIIFSILSLIGIAASLVLPKKFGNSILSYAGLYLMMILSVLNFAIVVSSRTDLIGTLWVTTLDAGNPLAVKAMNTGATSFFLYIIAAVLSIVSSFFSASKEEAAK